jgi:hypothetical protein
VCGLFFKEIAKMPREQSVPEHTVVTLDQFKDLKKDDLVKWEIKNRQALMVAPVDVVFAFTDKWERTVGSPYFRAVAKPDEHEIVDPRANNYCVPTKVKQIRWVKDKLRRGSSDAPYTDEVYNLEALTEEGFVESVLRGATIEQLPIYLPEEVAQEILSAKASKKNGVVECDITLPLLGYWEVRFHSKSNPDDTEEVHLASSGLSLQIEREKHVILPGSFLESADNGTYPVYKQEPGQDRKVVGRVSFYPYSVRRRSSRKEFEAMLNEGNRITKKARQDREREGKR